MGQAIRAFADWARDADPHHIAAAFDRSPRAVRLLDAPPTDRPHDKTYISAHQDSLTRIEEVFGASSTPEDYIESFKRFVADKGNSLPGHVAATQRPRELTRQELKDAARQLDAVGFSEATLRRAYGRARNADIAAHIIGFVHQAALGDPHVPYESRVDNAIEKMVAKSGWTDKQRQWLRRIGRALREMPVGDRETLEAPAFRQQGGFAAVDKVFDHKLGDVLQDLNEAIWGTSAA